MTGVEALAAMAANPGVRYTASHLGGQCAVYDGELFLFVQQGEETPLTFFPADLNAKDWHCAEAVDYLHGALAGRLRDLARDHRRLNAGDDRFAEGIERAAAVIEAEAAQ